MDELFLRNKTGENGVQVETESGKFTVICSRSPQNLEFGLFTLLFGGLRAKKCTKIYNARAKPLVFLIKSYYLRMEMKPATVQRLQSGLNQRLMN